MSDRSGVGERTHADEPAPATVRDIEYKGAPLDAERGPGLGCFWFQVIILGIFVVLTPLSVLWNWPPLVSGILLFVVIGLLLLTGQTVIFLLRLVAADRRGRRRPLASGTRTVGELEDEAGPTGATSSSAAATGDGPAGSVDSGPADAPAGSGDAAAPGSASPSGGPESGPPSVRE